MARPQSPILTAAELRIMRVLWDRKQASGRDIVDLLNREHSLAYTTVMSTLASMRSKGFVAAERMGRIDVFSPLISRKQAGVQALRHTLNQFFDSSPGLLAQHLLDEEPMSQDEWRELWERANPGAKSKVDR